MSVGRRYVKFRVFQLVVPLTIASALIVGRFVLGDPRVTVLVAPGTEPELAVDGVRRSFEPGQGARRSAHVPRGHHVVTVRAGAQPTAFTVELGALSNVLLPLDGQCFVWVSVLPGQPAIEKPHLGPGSRRDARRSVGRRRRVSRAGDSTRSALRRGRLSPTR